MTSKNSAITNLADNIKHGVDNRIKDLHTAMPGIVQIFDAETQTASVQPAVRRVFITRDSTEETLESKDLPMLINVPVQFPRGGGFSLTFPVKKGDECLLVFAERSIDYWHKYGEVRDPGARRFHSLSDATAFVGLSSLPNKVPNYDPLNVQLKKDDDTVSLTLNDSGDLNGYADKNVNLESKVDLNVTVGGNLNATITGDVSLTCNNLLATANLSAEVTAPTIILNGDVTVNGSVTVTGMVSAPTVSAANSLTVGAKEMLNHTHSQAQDSSGDTQSNTGAPI